MDLNADLDGFMENMEIYDELDATWEIVKELCEEMSDPTPREDWFDPPEETPPEAVPREDWFYPPEETPPEAVPREDWFDPPEETPPEYTPPAATSLTLEQLLEDPLADPVAPLIYPQQSFLQPGPMYWETQVRS